MIWREAPIFRRSTGRATANSARACPLESKTTSLANGMNEQQIDSQNACVVAILRSADLRPTRQRVAIGKLLFAGRDRHVTAEMLHEEVAAAGERISLATVYNTLHQFQRAGLIRELAIDGAKTYFDTNTSNHNHFFIESEGRVIDIPGQAVEVRGVPEPPDGTRISHIDVVVRLTKA